MEASRAPRSDIKPGIYEGLSFAEYRTIPAVSASGLEKLRRSPLQYQHSLTAPDRTSDALTRGTALHLAILEPDEFEARYVVSEPCAVLLKSGKREGQPCGNPGLFVMRGTKEWMCGQHVKGFGSLIDDECESITKETHATVIAMRDAVRAHDRARTLFEGRGLFEATVVWEDPETGVVCRARPDRLVERAGMNAEIKTTRDAAEWAFPAQAENLGYFRKLAFYRRGLRTLGWPYQYTAVLAIEAEPPFDLECYLADEGATDAALETADLEVSRLLRDYADCAKANHWPGYNRGAGFRTLRRPAWATKRNTSEE